VDTTEDPEVVSVRQAPMAGPESELAVIFPLMIMRFTTVEFPSKMGPLPIAGPVDALLAVILPLTIVRFTTVEFA
jgi:hypothetical protein